MTEVLIIGSGAGGGPLALRLAQAGVQVTVLEKGPRYTHADYARKDEIEVQQPGFWYPSPTEDPHMVVYPGAEEAEPGRLGWIAICLGGGTVHLGGYLYRFHPEDFRLKSRYGDYAEIADWPYSYEELEPYYCEAEREVGVSGLADANPFEGPRSEAYPMPPLTAHPLATHFDDACSDLGLHAFPTPRSINSVPYQGRPACAYCDLCAEFGCTIDAKGSSQVALIARAEATGNCTVVTQAAAREITVDRHGQASGCIYRDAEGTEHEIQAKMVCVCCSAVESARLLLLSRSPLFPDGIGNGNGLVGKNLQFHAVSKGAGRFRLGEHPHLPLDSRHPFLGRSVMDHYFLPEGIGDIDKGGLLRFGVPQPYLVTTSQNLARHGGKSVWGAELKSRLREHFLDRATVEFEVFHDYVPNTGTYVDLDPQARDRWGQQAARIHLELDAHHEVAGQFLRQRGLDILDRLGCDEPMPGRVAGVAEYLVAGSCRAGNDPNTSVLNEYCRSHEVPNLFVVDGSFMPSSGGAPPTLTILANSFRTADHILN